jgi:hypothetical protein
VSLDLANHHPTDAPAHSSRSNPLDHSISHHRVHTLTVQFRYTNKAPLRATRPKQESHPATCCLCLSQIFRNQKDARRAHWLGVRASVSSIHWTSQHQEGGDYRQTAPLVLFSICLLEIVGSDQLTSWMFIWKS